MRYIILVILYVMLAVPAAAAIIVSAQSGNWSSTSTWTGGVVPGDGDIAVIGTTSAGHSVTINQDIGTTGGGGIKNIHINHASSFLNYTGLASYTVKFASTGSNPVSSGTGASTTAPYGTSATYAYDQTMFGIYVPRGTLNLHGNSAYGLTLTTADGTSPIFINHDWSSYTRWDGTNWLSTTSGGTVLLRYVTINNLGGSTARHVGIYHDFSASGLLDVEHCTISKCYNMVKTSGATGASLIIKNNTITNFQSDVIQTASALTNVVVEGNTVSTPLYIRDESSPSSYTVQTHSFSYLAGTPLYFLNTTISSGSSTGWSVKNNIVTGGAIPGGKNWALKVGLWKVNGTPTTCTGELSGNTLINSESNNRDDMPSSLVLFAVPTTSLDIYNNRVKGSWRSIGLGTGSTTTQTGIKLHHNYFEEYADSWFDQGFVFFGSGVQDLDVYNNVFVIGTKAHTAQIVFPYLSTLTSAQVKNIKVRNNTFFNRNVRASWAAALTDDAFNAFMAGDNADPDSTIGPAFGLEVYNNVFKDMGITIDDSAEDNLWTRNATYGHAGIYANAANTYVVARRGLSSPKPIWTTIKRGTSPTYVADNQFSVVSSTYSANYKDLTKFTYPVGRRVRFNGTVYGTVSAASFVSGTSTTTVTLTMDSGQVVPGTITELATATGAFDDSGTAHPNATYGDIQLPALMFVNASGDKYEDFATMNPELVAAGVGGIDIGALPVRMGNAFWFGM